MPWEPKGKPLVATFLGSLSPERVLFEYEGPRSFLARDREGELLFAHQCGESADVWRYAVVPFSDELVQALEEGRLDLRTALEQPRFWLVDIGQGGVPKLCLRSSLASVPETCLPVPGVMLFPDLEPLLSVRSVGKNVELDQASLGLLRTSLDNTRNALKTLAMYVLGESQKAGQPSRKTRKYYDLPARLLAGSVRVSVYPTVDPQKPMFDESDETWSRMQQLLQLGLNEILIQPTNGHEPMGNDLRAALQAVYCLAPPSYGAVESIEVSGQLVTHSPTARVINRTVRATLRARLRLEVEQKMEIVEAQGFISELDREEATCLLRDSLGTTLHKIVFDEQLSDEVKDAFDSGREVKIAGQGTHPIAIVELLAVEFLS